MKIETATMEKMDIQPKGPKAFWLSDRFPDNYGDDIYFDSYNLAWGVDEDLSNCCVGKTEKVLAIIKGEETIPDNACAHTKRILTKLLNDRKEEEEANEPRTEISRGRLQRSSPTRLARTKQKSTLTSEIRKGLSNNLLG